MHWVDSYYYSTKQFSYPKEKKYILSLLDQFEINRFERFAFDHLKWTFATARWMVKTQLATKIGCEPKEVVLQYTDNGKPFVESDIDFSVSHTESGIAVALSNFPIGVDLELHERRGEPWRNTESFLNKHIAQELDVLATESEKKRGFSRYWTAMESFVKLKGSTLFQEKETFGVGLDLLDKDSAFRTPNNFWYTQDMDNEEQLTLCFEKKPETFSFKSFNGSHFVSVNIFDRHLTKF